jgi:hypothetical protein
MDKLRDVRFITPPFFFLGSLLVGAWLNNQIPDNPTQNVAAIIGLVVASLFPLGFAIASVSTLFLRAVFYICHGKNYQVCLSDETWTRIWPTLQLPTDITHTRDNEVDAAITFDHELLHEGIHASNVRLWSAFNIAVHSCWALLLSLIVGRYAFCITWSPTWLGTSSILLALFVTSAVITWREHMRMFAFQSYRIKNGRMPHATHDKPDQQKASE